MIKIKDFKIRQKKKIDKGYLLVSLPKVWVTDNNIKEGDTLAFFVDEHKNLIIKKSK